MTGCYHIVNLTHFGFWQYVVHRWYYVFYDCHIDSIVYLPIGLYLSVNFRVKFILFSFAAYVRCDTNCEQVASCVVV